MQDREILINSLNQIHTTEMGMDRISRNISIPKEMVISYCIELIKNEKSIIYRNGKNYYVEFENVILTINAYSYTIITAHKRKA